MDPESPNFDKNATKNEGCLVEHIFGCTDPKAANYNKDATIDDDTCISGLVTSTNSFIYNNDYNVYPNPVSDRLYINAIREYTAAPIIINIYNNSGRKVMTVERLIESDMFLNVGHLNKGVYIIELKDGKTGNDLDVGRLIKD